jgi:hypothetical protein
MATIERYFRYITVVGLITLVILKPDAVVKLFTMVTDAVSGIYKAANQ